MKTTDKFKLYLNSIINQIDPNIHEELWDELMDLVIIQRALEDAHHKQQGLILQWWVENGRDTKFAEHFDIQTMRDDNG